MTRRAPTRLEEMVERETRRIADRPQYFTKEEIVRAVLRLPTIVNVLREVGRIAPGWSLNSEIERRISAIVGGALQSRDENGIRIYECYPTGQGPRRWLRLRSMKRDDLIRVMQQTTKLRRTIEYKGEDYDVFDRLLVGLSAAATVEDVYSDAVEEIKRKRRRRSA